MIPCTYQISSVIKENYIIDFFVMLLILKCYESRVYMTVQNVLLFFFFFILNINLDNAV